MMEYGRVFQSILPLFHYSVIIWRNAMADEKRETRRPPGSCIPWEEKKKELPQITGDKELVKRQLEEIDALGYTYIWQVLLSF